MNGEERPPSLRERCRIVAGLDAIPALPANVFHLMAKLYESTTAPRDVERLVAGDPGLVTHLLGITNSLLFGLREKILNVQRAVTVIGLDNLRQILGAYAIRLMHNHVGQPKLQQALWQHAVSTGVAARLISEAKYGVAHAQAYVAGLLHDIGKVALFLQDAAGYADVAAATGPGAGASVSPEFARYGFSHLEAGWTVLEKLGFPPAMRAVAAFHHDPEYAPGGADMVWIVSLADLLVHHLGEEAPVPGCAAHLLKLGLSEERLMAARFQCRTDILAFQRIL